MNDFSKVEKIYEEWAEVNRKMYEECKAYLLEVLKKHCTIAIEEDYPCCVSYDGGNHPEYNSNCFSNVTCVSLDGDKIKLDTEDCIGYGIENINANELYAVADAVFYSVQVNYEEEG